MRPERPLLKSSRFYRFIKSSLFKKFNYSAPFVLHKLPVLKWALTFKLDFRFLKI